VLSVDYNADDLPDYGDRAAFFEPTASNTKISIKIRNLTKVLIYTSAGRVLILFMLFDVGKYV